MKRWRNLRGWLIAAAAGVGLIAAVNFVLLRPKPVDVRVARVVQGLVEETVTSTKAGSVRSRMVADVGTATAGPITAIHARKGARVKQGEPILSLDRRDADAGLAAARKDLAVLEAMAEEAEARRRDAERERDRLLELRKTGSVSQAQLDQAQTAAEAAAATAGAANARVEAQKTVIVRAQIRVDECRLLAPFDGIVADLHVEVGEWAVPGKPAVKLLDPDRLYVRAELDEVDVAKLKRGLEVRITLDPYKDRKVEGRVEKIAYYVSELKEQNRTVEVEVEFEEKNGGLQLLHGLSADVEVILNRERDVLRVPTLALLEGGRVLVVGEDGTARSATIRPGLKNWEYTQVLEGVAEGQLVIVSLESEKVKEGVRVRVAQESER